MLKPGSVKALEKIEARRLRAEEGLSIRAIASQLGVSKGSVSTWVRDIVLDEDQLSLLRGNNPIYNRQLNGAQARSAQARERRMAYQEDGWQKAQEGEPLHMAGCLLYWAEGAKSRHAVRFVNSDLDLMKLFLNFARRYFPETAVQATIVLHLHPPHLGQLEEIEQYWLDGLGLERDALRKHQVDRREKKSSRAVRNRLPYGTCHLSMHNVKMVQHIYGGIGAYASTDATRFL